jgi:uncharacterized protein
VKIPRFPGTMIISGQRMVQGKAECLQTQRSTRFSAACGPRSTRSTGPGSSGSCCTARARGEERPDSDYDVAVSINNPGRLGEELHRLASLTTDILLDTGAVISALPFRAGAYREQTGFMRELRADGLDL